VAGLVVMLLLYAVILAMGLGISWWKGTLKSNRLEDVMLAGRNLNMYIGIFTLTG